MFHPLDSNAINPVKSFFKDIQFYGSIFSKIMISKCGGCHWLAHPPSQDILSSTHHNLINNETAVVSVSENCKVVSVCDAIRCSSKQVAGYRHCTYAEKSCCVHIQLCVCLCTVYVG
jgi:hypothetical protein